MHDLLNVLLKQELDAFCLSPRMICRVMGERRRTVSMFNLSAAERRLMVTPVNELSELHTSKIGCFSVMQSLSSRLTWHDFEIRRSRTLDHSGSLAL